jgi:hypothetical protein
MSRVLSLFGQLKPTEKGRMAVKSEGFIRLAKEIAAAVVVSGRPYEEMETRLRTLTIDTLLPQRRYSPDEVADFYRGHWPEVDSAWREAIAPLMTDVDTDPVGAISRELGVHLPNPRAA